MKTCEMQKSHKYSHLFSTQELYWALLSVYLTVILFSSGSLGQSYSDLGRVLVALENDPLKALQDCCLRNLSSSVVDGRRKRESDCVSF